MKIKILLLAMIILTAFTASCASEAVLPTRPEEAVLATPPAASENSSKKLTIGIYSLSDYSSVFDSRLWEIEDYWTERHPDIEIEFIDYADLNDRMGGINDYTQRMSVMLMSGTAPDIIDLTFLRTDKLFTGGFITDLYPFIDSDPDISLDDYFPNIISALDFGGSLFTLPSSLYPGIIFVNRNFADIVKQVMGDKVTMNYLDMIRCYEAVLNSGISPTELYISDAWTNSAGSWYVTTQMEGPRFFDMSNETVNFGPDFINTMNTIEPFLVDSGVIIKDGVWPINTLFVQNSGGSLAQFFDETTTDIPVTLPFLSESSTGYARIFNQSTMYVINSQSPLKEAAWDFIKFRHTSPEIRQQEASQKLPTKISEFQDLMPDTLGFTETSNFICRIAGVDSVSIIGEVFFDKLKAETNKYTETEIGLVFEPEPWQDMPEGYKVIYVTPKVFDGYSAEVNKSSSAGEYALRLEKMVKAVNYWDYDIGPDITNDFRMLSEGIIIVEQLAQSLNEKYTLYLSQ